MSWDEIEPPKPACSGLASPVMLTTFDDRHGGLKVTVTFRPWLMEHPPTWLVSGARVRVLFGTLENVGMMRLLNGGGHGLRPNMTGGQQVPADRRSLTLTLRRVKGVDGIEHVKGAEATCDWSDQGTSWFEIALPIKAKVALANGAAAPAPKVPFTGIKGVISREEATARRSGPIR